MPHPNVAVFATLGWDSTPAERLGPFRTLREVTRRGDHRLTTLDSSLGSKDPKWPAAPPFAVLEAWAPRTSTPCSFVTYKRPVRQLESW